MMAGVVMLSAVPALLCFVRFAYYSCYEHIVGFYCHKRLMKIETAERFTN